HRLLTHPSIQSFCHFTYPLPFFARKTVPLLRSGSRRSAAPFVNPVLRMSIAVIWRLLMLLRQQRGGRGEVRLEIAAHNVGPWGEFPQAGQYRGLHTIATHLDDPLRDLHQFAWSIDNIDPTKEQRRRQRKHFDIE